MMQRDVLNYRKKRTRIYIEERILIIVMKFSIAFCFH